MSSTRKLLDHWLPPEGAGRALGCLATTFTFDADFFEQQCVGRFLGLDTRPGEAANDLPYVIEREEKLAETSVCVVADRSLNPDSRSLRWDVLTVQAPTGVMHAKVALLVWERAVRVLVSSANLSERAYRQSIELAVVLDAGAGGELPRQLFDDLIGAVEQIVQLAPRGRASGLGPQPRAFDILSRARDRIDSFGLPDRPPRGSPRMAVVARRPGRDALDGAMDTWSGGPPRRAKVMSPYFDTVAGASRAAKRLSAVLAKREASVDFVVAVERLGERETARVPQALVAGFPSRVPVELFEVKPPDPAEPRSLHGKLIILESREWVSALVGSSNFTAAGLGLDGGGNVEIGVAIGAPRQSEVGRALGALLLQGERLQLDDVELEATEDPDEREMPVPSGFVQVLGDPGPPAMLEFELDPNGLPDEWTAMTPDSQHLLASDRWREEGRPDVLKLTTPTGDLPFNVALEWRAEGDTWQRASLPVNVTEPSRLPAPEELRGLPVDALLRALASIRPLHEAVVDAWRHHDRRAGISLTDLDPLKRFSSSGQLLHRTRELSAALDGLRKRLERPAATLDAFRWRMEGPFGPVAIARKLIDERRSDRALEGEEAFMLAEIGLTLAGVDVDKASRFVPDQRKTMREALQQAIGELDSLCPRGGTAPALDEYVREAFASAGR